MTAVSALLSALLARLEMASAILTRAIPGVDPASAVLSVALVGLTVLLAWVHVSGRRNRSARDGAALQEKVEKKQHLAHSLHPVIDTDLCIGSGACIKACHENALGIVNGVGRLIHADQCIGHGKCAFECPVGAIKLVMGTEERGVDLPEVDPYFESSRAGVYVVGELGGMGLIRNAVQQGLEAGRRLSSILQPGRNGKADVAIVGAGPAGLAAALQIRAAGLSYRLLEQTAAGGSIAQYPRHKIVMTDRMKLPIYGNIGERVIRKEKLLASWFKAVEKGGIVVEEGVKVEGIEGHDGDFLVKTSRGPVKARKVILATGRRGTPRKLGVPGEELPKVTYGLVDPTQYDDKRVLVVGAGDSALEAASQLAEESSAKVSMSYRGESFARAREANRKRVEAHAAEKRVSIYFSSEVKSIGEGWVELKRARRKLMLLNDYVIVLIGGEPPSEFLKKAGIEMRRYTGQTMAIRIDDKRKGSGKEDEGTRRRRRRTTGLYMTLAALAVALLAVKGWEYYPLTAAERLRSPLHALLKPSGAWGHGLGLAATAFMLATFLLAARKRLSALQMRGDIRNWLDFHVFVGFMSPIVTAFHAAFRSNNLLANATLVSLAVVTATGIVGRFIYGMVPSVDGHVVELGSLAARFEKIRARARPLMAATSNRAPLEALLDLATEKVPAGSLLGLALRVPASALRLRFRMWRVRRLIADTDGRARFRDSLVRLNRIRYQVAFYNELRRMLRVWRVLHAVLAGFLVFAITAHIAVTVFLGYGFGK